MTRDCYQCKKGSYGDYEEYEYDYEEYEETDCAEHKDRGYYCVPYYQCDNCHTIIVDGKGFFDQRSPECNIGK